MRRRSSAWAKLDPETILSTRAQLDSMYGELSTDWKPITTETSSFTDFGLAFIDA